MTDVLFVVEAGNAPARTPKAFTLPVPTGSGLTTVSISYPVIEASKDATLSAITASGEQLKLEGVVDVNVMARRALRDAMPGMVMRNVTRAVGKAVLQDQLAKNTGMFGALLGMAGSIATEQADDRMWRMLPGRVYVARGYLPPGAHKLVIDGREVSGGIKIDGQYAMVPIRLYGTSIVQGEVMVFGQLVPPPATAQKEEAEKTASNPASASKKAKKKTAATAKSKIKPPVVSPSASAGKPLAKALQPSTD
jgi:hypothetical protein